jgi:ribose transport system permease protein
VAFGRLQPIVVTLATASIYGGIALFVRPNPGGFVPEWYTDLLTGTIGGFVPASLVLLGMLIALWIPFRRTRLSVTIYAIGNNRVAAYLSGVATRRVLVAVYMISGLLPAFTGILLTGYSFQSCLGMGENYILPPIAAVVIGGTSILGGSGGYGGTIAGAIIVVLLYN